MEFLSLNALFFQIPMLISNKVEEAFKRNSEADNEEIKRISKVHTSLPGG